MSRLDTGKRKAALFAIERIQVVCEVQLALVFIAFGGTRHCVIFVFWNSNDDLTVFGTSYYFQIRY